MSVVDGLAFSEEKKVYIVEVLDPVLEEMIADVLADLPEVPLDFMISWLSKRSGISAGRRKSMKQQNVALKQELSVATAFIQDSAQMVAQAADPEPEEEEDEDDELEEAPEEQVQSKGKARKGVSAEAYGEHNQKKEFVPVKYPKTDQQKERLSATLLQSFMFKELDTHDMDTVILAMKEIAFSAGTKVITQGEDGDYLFVIESGSLDCIINIEGEDKVVKTCAPGDVFGELALLYNCPRAANVVAKDECVCWQLDRDTVSNVVQDAATKRRDKYNSFLKSVALLASIGDYERSQVADALKVEVFSKGEMIVKQDEPGDKFYIVEEGSLYAEKNTPGDGPKKVKEYKAGDYFGELALLKNQPRAASVVVESSNARVLVLGRQSFTKMLGPLQHILARNVEAYT